MPRDEEHRSRRPQYVDDVRACVHTSRRPWAGSGWRREGGLCGRRRRPARPTAQPTRPLEHARAPADRELHQPGIKRYDDIARFDGRPIDRSQALTPARPPAPPARTTARPPTGPPARPSGHPSADISVDTPERVTGGHGLMNTNDWTRTSGHRKGRKNPVVGFKIIK